MLQIHGGPRGLYVTHDNRPRRRCPDRQRPDGTRRHPRVVGEWRPVNGRKDQEKNEDKIRGH